MKYYIDRAGTIVEGTVVAQQGIYELVQFDIDPLFDLIEQMTGILKMYFPDYIYDENNFVYGIAVGERLVVNGPGNEGCAVSFEDLNKAIQRCEKKAETTMPFNWKNETEQIVYDNLHSSFMTQTANIEKCLCDIYKNKCELGALIKDEEKELIYIDISKTDYKLRVSLKGFSAQIAHISSDVQKLSEVLKCGAKAVVGYQLLAGEWEWELDNMLSEAIYDLQEKRGSYRLNVFDDGEEDYCGNYEHAAIIDLYAIGYSFVHVVYVLLQRLSGYDPVKVAAIRKEKEEALKRTELETFEDIDLSYFEDLWIKMEPPITDEVSRYDYAPLFDEWLLAIGLL